MMSLGPYASFIVSAYSLVAVVLALLIGWIAVDYRNQTRRLRGLEESGVVRRSGRSAVEDPSRAARAAAVLTLVGAINLPIIKFSVDWWNTLHQPASVLRMGGSTLDRAFLIPLLVMAIAFTLLFVTLHLAAMRNEILRRRVRSLQMMQASSKAA